MTDDLLLGYTLLSFLAGCTFGVLQAFVLHDDGLLCGVRYAAVICWAAAALGLCVLLLKAVMP